MKSGKIIKIAIGTLFIIGNMAVSPAYANSKCQQRYSVTDIGTLGGPNAISEGINNRGELVGWSSYPDELNPRAFLWTKDDLVMRYLGDLGGNYCVFRQCSPGASFANAINDRGDVVGSSSALPDSSFHAFLWRHKDGQMQDLGTLPPHMQSSAQGINFWGRVVGTNDYSQRAFLWSPVNQKMRGLGSLGDNATGSGASAISNLGHIVGFSIVPNGLHAVLWSPITRRIRDLGTLGSDDSFAEAVNDRGEVAGVSRVSSTEFDAHTFFWSQGRMRDLSTLGGNFSDAHGMNNWGQVVGQSQTSSGADHAFLWSKECGMQDLNDLIPPSDGVVLSSASDINDLHQIAADGDLGDRTHAYLLTPVN